MKYNNFFTALLLLGFLAVSIPVTSVAEESADETSSLFKFQHKLALRNNVPAQYKLACMYEAGDGVKQDVAQAEHWYGLASKGGMKAAEDRLVYLTVKKQGYDQAKHSSWLASVKADADAGKGQAMFLLAQLYHEGLGVEKDLDKSLKFFQQVSLLGDANVQNEMALVRAEMDASKQAEQHRQQKKEVEEAREVTKEAAPVAQPKKEKKEEPKFTKEQQLAQQAEAEKIEMAEKVRRYEAAMLKLKLEQKQIDELQSNIESRGKEGAD